MEVGVLVVAPVAVAAVVVVAENRGVGDKTPAEVTTGAPVIGVVVSCSDADEEFSVLMIWFELVRTPDGGLDRCPFR